MYIQIKFNNAKNIPKIASIIIYEVKPLKIPTPVKY